MVQRGAIEAIPEDIDADMTAIRVGERLGIPAREVFREPLHWVRTVLVLMKVELLAQEKARKDMERRRKKQAKPRTRPR